MPALVLALALCAAPPPAGESIDDILAAWKRAFLDSKSVEVNASIDHMDNAFKEKKQSRLRLRLVRAAGIIHSEITGVLDSTRLFVIGTDGYILRPEDRSASKLTAGRSPAAPVQVALGLPVADLFDPRPFLRGTVRVYNRDAHYAYLYLRGWKSQGYTDKCFVAVPLRDGPGMTKFLPLRTTNIAGNGDRKEVNVKAYRIDGATPPQPSEFVRPEKRPGWTVVDAPRWWFTDGLENALFGR